MTKRVIVTSALPYANGPIHFGHIVGAYLPADIYVRFRRMLGDDVHFVCGTDEHGAAITLKAEAEGCAYEAYVDRWHDEIRGDLEALDIEFDIFSGTAHHRNPFHRELAQQVFLDVFRNGYLHERTTEQYFSPTLQRFLPDRYVEATCYNCGYERARGDECPRCGNYLDPAKLTEVRCTIDGSTPVLKETKHWFLDLARIRDEWTRGWLEAKRGKWKPNVINFAVGGMSDLRERAMTRDLDWGVPVPLPDTAGKTLYVWFDAPVGYLSISKQHWHERGRPERFEEFWKSPDTELYHFLGKDNITFHTVVFPSMLHATRAGWIVPTDVPANEFFHLEGRKFSTSEGWVIPEECIRGFPADVLRYALCTMMPETADSEWTWEEFKNRVNGELADNLGNFVTRTLRFCERFFDGSIPELGELDDADRALQAAARTAAAAFTAQLDAFGFRRACQTLMGLSTECNRYFDAAEPWRLVKSADTRDRAGHVLRMCAEMIRGLSALCAPIMPATARMLRAALGLEREVRLDEVGEVGLRGGPAPLSEPLPTFEDAKGNRKTALFLKVPDELVEREQRRLREMAERFAGATDPGERAPTAAGEQAATIEFDTFAAVDLRAGVIVAAERHPDADRLLVLDVDLGFERRTIVAGVAGTYAPEDLVGTRVVAVTNLAPRKLRGVESRGMLLAVDGADGKPRLLEPAAGTPLGSRVK